MEEPEEYLNFNKTYTLRDRTFKDNLTKKLLTRALQGSRLIRSIADQFKNAFLGLFTKYRNKGNMDETVLYPLFRLSSMVNGE